MDRTQVFLLFQPLALAVQILITLLAWRRRRHFAGFEFFFFSLGLTLLNLLAVLSTFFRPPFAAYLFEQRFSFASLGGLPPLVYAWVLAAYDPRAIRRWIPALAAVPVLGFVLGLSNPLHHLMIESVSMDSGRLFSYPLDVVHASGYIVTFFYNSILISLGLGLVAIAAAVGGPRLRRQRLLFLAGCPILVVPTMLVSYQVIPRELDPTVYTSTTWLVMTAVGAFTASPFELAPLARSQIVETMQDGLILLDREGRIVDANPASESLLDRRAELIVGRLASEVLRDVEDSLALTTPNEPIPAAAGPEPLTLRGRRVDAWTLPVEHAEGTRYTGQLIILRPPQAARVLSVEADPAFSLRTPVPVDADAGGGPVSMCTRCKSVRDERGNWQLAESFLEELLDAEFSQGICYTCTEDLYPEYARHLRHDWDDADAESPPDVS